MTSARYPVSRNGGTVPLWSHSGKELFFRGSDSTLVAAGIATGQTPVVTSIKVLFRTPLYVQDPRHRAYAAASNDESFLFVKDSSLKKAPRIHVVVNLPALLKAKVGR